MTEELHRQKFTITTTTTTTITTTTTTTTTAAAAATHIQAGKLSKNCHLVFMCTWTQVYQNATPPITYVYNDYNSMEHSSSWESNSGSHTKVIPGF